MHFMEKRKAFNAMSKDRQKAVNEAWERINVDIVNRALTLTPRPKVFEVHHEAEKARDALLTSAFNGDDINYAERQARQAIGL